MILRYKKYEKRYLSGCMKLIQETWPFEETLQNPKRPMYLYAYYVLNCVNWSDHLDLLVDEKGNVLGILFGSVHKNNAFKSFVFSLTQWKINLTLGLHILMGDLGQRKAAIATYRAMCEHDADGEAVAEDYDGEVNLFILSPRLRGKGYGRELMNRYIKFCHKNHLDSVFLWTTTDCTFRFYEQYGFQERQRFAIKAQAGNESTAEEGIVFYKKI